MDERVLQIQHCMYQYSRAIYRSIKDLIDPYVDPSTQLEYRREVLAACEGTMERLAADPHYFAKPDRTLFAGHPPLLPDHRAGAGRLVGEPGRRRGGRVHRGADRVRRVRGRHRPLPRDDPQGKAVPADAAAGARLLPLPSASRSREVARSQIAARLASGSPAFREPIGSRKAMSHDTDKLIRQLSLVAFLMAELRPADGARHQGRTSRATRR